MPIKVGDQVGFYRQIVNNQEYTWCMEYLTGMVIEFIDPTTVKVKTRTKDIILPYVALTKLGWENNYE